MLRSRLAGLLVLLVVCSGVVVYVACNGDDAANSTENRVLPNVGIDWRDQVIYQILTDRFADGDVNNNWKVDRTSLAKYQGGDYQGIIDNLWYLEALGVTAIWISPIVKNVEDDAGVHGYHGYWTQDFTRLNPHFGTLGDLRRLVNACHDRGILVICDIVTNHIGQLFYYDMNQNGVPDQRHYGSGTAHTNPDNLYYVLEYDPPWDPKGVQTSVGSPYEEQGHSPIRWLRDVESNHMPIQPPEFQNPSWYHRRGRVVPEPNGNWPFAAVQFGDFPGGNKDLATERQDVREALIRVFSNWIQKVDFDGFRIDTLKHIERASDIPNWENFTWTESLDGSTHSGNLFTYEDGPTGVDYPDGYPGFWEVFCPAMRLSALAKGKQNFFMFGEAYDGDDQLCGSYTLTEGMVDSVFNFPEKYVAMNGVIAWGGKTRNIENLWNARNGHYKTTPQANGVGVAPLNIPVNFVDNHDVTRFVNEGYDRFKNVDRGNEKKVQVALAYVFAREGVPCVYYGTEQIFTGVGPGLEDPNAPTPPTGETAVPFTGRGDPTNREVLWDTGFDTSKPMFQWIRKLAGIRRQHEALRRGEQKITWASDSGAADAAVEGRADAGIFAFERYIPGGEVVLFVMNVHTTQDKYTHDPDNPSGNVMKVSFAANSTVTDLLSGETFQVDGSGQLDVMVPPISVRFLVAQ
ncbi:alpha-amylase family glycosyl hydrolase [Planctomycetota bacterium]